MKVTFEKSLVLRRQTKHAEPPNRVTKSII